MSKKAIKRQHSTDMVMLLCFIYEITSLRGNLRSNRRGNLHIKKGRKALKNVSYQP